MLLISLLSFRRSFILSRELIVAAAFGRLVFRSFRSVSTPRADRRTQIRLRNYCETTFARLSLRPPVSQGRNCNFNLQRRDLSTRRARNTKLSNFCQVLRNLLPARVHSIFLFAALRSRPGGGSPSCWGLKSGLKGASEARGGRRPLRLARRHTRAGNLRTPPRAGATFAQFAAVTAEAIRGVAVACAKISQMQINSGKLVPLIARPIERKSGAA